MVFELQFPTLMITIQAFRYLIKFISYYLGVILLTYSKKEKHLRSVIFNKNPQRINRIGKRHIRCASLVIILAIVVYIFNCNYYLLTDLLVHCASLT